MKFLWTTLFVLWLCEISCLTASHKVTTPGYFANRVLDELYLLSESKLETFIAKEVKKYE